MRPYYRIYLLQDVGNFNNRMGLQQLPDNESFSYDRDTLIRWLEEYIKRNVGNFTILELYNQFPPIHP